MSPLPRFKLTFFCPPAVLARCKAAVFAAGAGRHPGPGGYTEVCFTTRGQAQFRPGPSAQPHIGTVGQLEELEEVRCEMLCLGEEVVRGAVGALKGAHPYEEPVYEVYKMADF
ncbi:structural toxin protein RtxA [Saccharata proteae CBS 121410]|uniref:ATP phosphoribosyltransferase n=1 Tax=Saccharata proteae CBS 121410 TaxID=1314787 RepID=A0A9P4LX03_9PEZI|nr:structural toxin protein RtxA [Saccharata proteae CBS 121410]